MITEDYVSFEIAKLLKEKGFNEVCEMFYCKPHEGYLKNLKRDEWWNSDLREDMTCTCPTLQMAMKWLREVHFLFIVIDPLTSYKWWWSIWLMNDSSQKMGESLCSFSTYKEACETAIKYCLENLI